MNQTYELIVKRDQDIRKAIGDFVYDQGWEAAYVSGAIGSVTDCCFTAPQTDEFPPNVGKVLVKGPGEVLAFTGEIMKKEYMDDIMKKIYEDDGHPLFIHIHASVAISGAHVYGGGLMAGKSFRKLKVYLQQANPS